MVKELILKGRVQGVFCRNYCSQYGARMGIKGAATNLYDGTVQVLLDCDETKAHQYIKAITENPLRIRFNGRIDDVDIREYSGAISGDYNF